MTHHRKIVGAAVAVAMASLALTGCSTSDSSDGGGLTLTLWHNTQDPQAILDLYSAYEKYSGNKLDIIDIPSDGFEDATLTRWAAGDRPDIMEFHGLNSVMDLLNAPANLQNFSDMDFVKESGSMYDIGGRGSDGNVYAAITSFPEVWGLYYNRSVLDKYGLQPATTQAELLEQCKVLSAAGVTTLAESGASIWPPQAIPLVESGSLAPAGWAADVIAKKTTIDASDSPVLAGLENYKELIDSGCMNSDITSATFEDSVSSVYKGEAAYQALHSNIASVYLDAAGGDAQKLADAVGFTSFGAETKGTAVNPGPIGTYMAPKTGDSAKEAAALDFIKFATGQYYQTYIDESGTFPVISTATDPKDTTPLLQEIKDQYDEGPTFGFVNGALPGGMQGQAALLSELIAGQKSPADVAAALQSQMAAAAKSQGVEGW